MKTLQDAVLNLGDLKKANPRFCDKKEIYQAMQTLDYEFLRDVSNYYYRVSGIYQRLCRYMAYMYRYDWIVTPYVFDENMKSNKLIEGFHQALEYLDNFNVKKFFGEVALKVLRNGCYYGYLVPVMNRMSVQELPPKYCRSRFTLADGRPAVEFNMKFFDDNFRDVAQREKMLSLFPEEFAVGYRKYKQGKLVPDFQGDTAGWYLLDADRVIKFNINGEDFPALISVVPALIDLDEAQGLDRKKMQQQLLKIIIQKMPVDKNGDLVFDVDEAQQLHENAVRMLARAIGVDVLTTFADVDVADMTNNTAATAADDGMDRVKQAIYDQAGVSQMQFNTDGNIALEKSILNDEASIYNLIQQFEMFLNLLLKPYNKNPKKVVYRVQILGTTIYNYQNMAKYYKENMQLGFSKTLPQIALGQSQSSVLATAYFENDILDLVNVFIPPMSSNVMNAEVLDRKKGNNNSGDSKSGNGAGRPTKESQGESVTEKTIKNKESQS